MLSSLPGSPEQRLIVVICLFFFFSLSLWSVLPLLQPGAAAPHPNTLNTSRARTLSPSRHPAGTCGDLGSDKRKIASPRPAQNSLKSPCQPRRSSLRSSQALFSPFPSAWRSPYLLCGVLATPCSCPWLGKELNGLGSCSKAPLAACGPAERSNRRLIPQEDVSHSKQSGCWALPEGEGPNFALLSRRDNLSGRNLSPGLANESPTRSHPTSNPSQKLKCCTRKRTPLLFGCWVSPLCVRDEF